MSGASYDCVVIGGGPAGSVAAVYLARFCRKVLLLDAERPRARWIPRTRNIPAYPDGIEGGELLKRLRSQVERYAIERIAARASRLEGTCGNFAVHADGGSWRAERVLLACGVEDRMPEHLEHLWTLVRRGAVRLCPVCDAFELCGKRIGLIAEGEHGETETRFLRTYSSDVTLFPPSEVVEVLTSAAGIAVRRRAGNVVACDALYVGLGVEVGSELAARLGARRDAQGYLAVDQRQQTSVPGLYAAGDVVQSLSQISVAFGQAAIAASAINTSLSAAA